MKLKPLPQYNDVVIQLAPMLHNLPFKIVGIDGMDGAGKTTLGRYLCWCFNVSLIESDLFLLEAPSLKYRLECIKAAIEHRHRVNRPVILEGIALLELSSQLGIELDFLIYVENSKYGGSHGLAGRLEAYRHEYNPEKAANVCITLDCA